MLIAPTEPARLRQLGRVSSVPEKKGADYLILGHDGYYGVQRKEINDFVASVNDGRLAKELDQMQVLRQGIVLIEGKVAWTDDGTLLTTSSTLTRAQYQGCVWSIQSRGYWVDTALTLADSITYLSSLSSWSRKKRHSSLRSRPKPTSQWGTRDSKEWGIHLLQSFEGIGHTQAAEIWDAFKGVPLCWTVSPEELLKVKGLGKGKVGMLMNLLDYVELRSEDDAQEA